MRRLSEITLTLLVCLGTTASGTAAQTAKDMVGTWNLVSDVNTSADGRKVEPFGPSPRGIAIFDSDGHFAIVVSRPDLPKFASNNRMQGTPEENKAIVQGSIGFFGTYAVADGAVIQHVEGGTWPSWIGTDQKRTITSGLFTKGTGPSGRIRLQSPARRPGNHPGILSASGRLRCSRSGACTGARVPTNTGVPPEYLGQSGPRRLPSPALPRQRREQS